MIIENISVLDDGAIKAKITGFSHETKPSNYAEGSEFFENDTNKLYILVGGEWKVQTSGEGGQGGGIPNADIVPLELKSLTLYGEEFKVVVGKISTGDFNKVRDIIIKMDGVNTESNQQKQIVIVYDMNHTGFLYSNSLYHEEVFKFDEAITYHNDIADAGYGFVSEFGIPTQDIYCLNIKYDSSMSNGKGTYITYSEDGNNIGYLDESHEIFSLVDRNSNFYLLYPCDREVMIEQGYMIVEYKN